MSLRSGPLLRVDLPRGGAFQANDIDIDLLTQG
jgi:hypothetical protein